MDSLYKERYLPDTELGVVDDVISHGELGLVVRRINGFNLADYAALRAEDVTVLFRYVGQNCHN